MRPAQGKRSLSQSQAQARGSVPMFVKMEYVNKLFRSCLFLKLRVVLEHDEASHLKQPLNRKPCQRKCIKTIWRCPSVGSSRASVVKRFFFTHSSGKGLYGSMLRSHVTLMESPHSMLRSAEQWHYGRLHHPAALRIASGGMGVT